MKTAIKAALKDRFTEEEVAKIEAFIDKGFSEGGRVVVASIFLRADEEGKTVAQVLEQCEKEWPNNWNFQHPDLRGDPDAPGGAGRTSRIALLNIYNALGIKPPNS